MRNLLPILLVACGGVSTTIPDAGMSATDGGDASAADVAAEASSVDINLTTCPALTPCGGDVTGTWNLSAGCLADPLATAESLCPTLVVHSQTATASGSVTFLGGLVTRNYVAHYEMDITVPTLCLVGLTCAQAQTDYQAYIPNTTCTAVTGGCECTGSIDTTAAEASGYTTANDEILTASGDTYAYCVTGSTMQYHHVSGPTTEVGTYTLTHE